MEFFVSNLDLKSNSGAYQQHDPRWVISSLCCLPDGVNDARLVGFSEDYVPKVLIRVYSKELINTTVVTITLIIILSNLAYRSEVKEA